MNYGTVRFCDQDGKKGAGGGGGANDHLVGTVQRDLGGRKLVCAHENVAAATPVEKNGYGGRSRVI